jgi:hypothetical protein
MKTRRLVALACSLSFVPASLAQEQCRAWSSGFARPGFGHEVHVTAEYGGEVYAGGYFNWADGVKTHHVARWDGSRWRPAGLGVGTWPTTALQQFQERVSALAVYEDGAGPALYAGGRFASAGGAPASNVARWDGTSWSALVGSDGSELSANSYVEALAVYDGASGPELIVGGSLYVNGPGGLTSRFVARWDGADWLAFPEEPNNKVYALLAFDDGGGTKLYVGGDFTAMGSLSTGPIASWDGAAWGKLPAEPGLSGNVRALLAHDTGAGPALHVLGSVKSGGFPTYAVGAYEGGVWNMDGSVTGGGAETGAVYDDGNGSTLYVGGGFTIIDGVYAEGIARSDGAGGWSALPVEPKPFTRIDTLAVHDDGGGVRLFAGGQLQEFGPYGVPAVLEVGYIATWDGSAWAALGNSNGGPDGTVFDLEYFDDGSGAGLVLHVVGKYRRVGPIAADRAARWDGSSWTPLGSGTDAVIRAAEVFDDGSGSALFAGGDFANAGGVPAANVARWDGAQWSAVGAGPGGVVHALLGHDDGSGAALYAGLGSLGGVSRWDGTSWSVAGAGLPTSIVDFAVHDGGSGPRLYAAGGTFAVGEVHEWDGSSWTLIGTMDLGVEALASFDDGGGPQLYAGGNFNQVGGVFLPHVARWNGSWSAVGNGQGNSVRELFVYDDGGGARLVALGVLAPTFARAWDGSSWSTFQGGLDASARASAVNGSELYVGGGFEHVDKELTRTPSWHIARFGPGTGCAPQNYCTAGTSSVGCNALLSAAGFASSSLSTGFFVDAAGVPAGKQGLFYFGLNGKKATPWGAGSSWFCVKGPHQRLAVQSSGGSGACDGSFATDFNAWMNQNPGKAPGAGAAVYLQAWFRDPPAPKTTAFSDAVWFVVNP